jgi:hypothetical protein
MLTNDYRGLWSLSCDSCGKALQESHMTWADANPNKNNISRYARRLGWRVGAKKQFCKLCKQHPAPAPVR